MGLSNNSPTGVISSNPPRGSEPEEVSRIPSVPLCKCGQAMVACGGQHPDVRFARPERPSFVLPTSQAAGERLP